MEDDHGGDIFQQFTGPEIPHIAEGCGLIVSFADLVHNGRCLVDLDLSAKEQMVPHAFDQGLEQPGIQTDGPGGH